MIEIATTIPTDFGAPSKYDKWRTGQEQLFWDLIDSRKRFSIHNALVGMGKSLCYVCAAGAMGGRSIILTATKSLQDQLAKDFHAQVFDMRGLGNYTCQALAEGGFLEDMWVKKWGRPTCDIGPCTAGIKCDLKNQGCDYFDEYRLANGASVVQTNYAYWIAINKYGQGLGNFDRMFIDECHAAPNQIAAMLSVEFSPKEYRELKSKPPSDKSKLSEWKMWSRVQLGKVQTKLERFTSGARIGERAGGLATFTKGDDLPDAAELKMWKKLESKCTMLSEAGDDWIVSVDEDTGNVKIAPVWIRKYAEDHLFRGIPRIAMLSGTVRPKLADLLGLATNSWEFKEYPSTFPVERRPIYHIPTVALSVNSSEEDLMTWVVRIDQVISRRLDRKGIIHTVSYPRQRFLLEHSRFKHLMFSNKPGTTRDVVQSFRDAKAPAVLVSPSVGTGFDFSDDFARYQIIAKMPFRDMRSPMLKVQMKEDPEYLDHLVAEDLEQIYGRPNRSETDFSETIVVDDNFGWFWKRKTKSGEFLFSDYFREAVQTVTGVPDPPPLSMFQV